MAVLKAKQTKITGVCCALPREGRNVYEVGAEHFDEETIRKIVSPVGTETLYFAAGGQTSADICAAAAERLIASAGVDKADVDALIFVSQTPEYRAPATSCILQDRLGLSKDCAAMDLNFGCSGFVYGVYTAASMIESGACDKVLVLTGDTLRRHISDSDKAMTFILSDAGAATLVEKSAGAPAMTFIMKTDGSGYESLIIPAGAERLPESESTKEIIEVEGGSFRSAEDFYMDGMAVFTFAVKEVPALLNELADKHGFSKGDVDFFLFHQANAYMLKFIAKRAEIDMDRVPVNIGKYGNTNGSTIPFLLADIGASGTPDGAKVMMSGFGVGLSWGGIATEISALKCAQIITV